MKKYVFKPYDKSFPELFLKEKKRILSHVKNALSVEHIGSTAVPHLGGKGIIDIAICANQADIDFISQQLQELGYEFRPNFSTADRLYFVTYLPDLKEESRRYHIHLTHPENKEWNAFLEFRDYLISHPQELQEYEQLKKQAALEANDEGEHYRKIKAPMFKKIHSLTALPLPTGPYQVGTAKYDLEDIYRKDFVFPNGRLIPIQIYFPMKQANHIPTVKIFEERAAIAPFEPLKVKVHSQQAELSHLVGNKHPVIFLNHATAVAMTDYAFLAEELTSHGYVVISIQHDLILDRKAPAFWEGRSCSKNAKVIDNILYVFEWLKQTEITLFAGKIDLKRIGLIGHSLGANSLLFWVNRTLDSFSKDTRQSLFSRIDEKDVKECLILMENTKFSFPINSHFPLFFLLSEERELYQKSTGSYEQMVEAGHQVHYYKGSTHISFMDHGYINPASNYFNGSLEERIAFFKQVRKDILNFLNHHLY